MKQTDKICEWLSSGRTLTVAEALTNLGIYALSQRVGELKRQGVPIEADMVETAGGARVARYRLAIPH